MPEPDEPTPDRPRGKPLERSDAELDEDSRITPEDEADARDLWKQVAGDLGSLLDATPEDTEDD